MISERETENPQRRCEYKVKNSHSRVQSLQYKMQVFIQLYNEVNIQASLYKQKLDTNLHVDNNLYIADHTAVSYR